MLKFGGRGALMGMGTGVLRRGVNEVVYKKPLDICYDFVAVLNLTTPFLGNGCP